MSSNWKQRKRPKPDSYRPGTVKSRKDADGTDREGLFRIGTVAKPHGLHGDFFLFLECDLLDWLLGLDELIVLRDGKPEVWPVTYWRQQGDRILLRLKALPDRTAVENHRGLALFVDEEQVRAAMDPEFFLNSDLVGMTVMNLTHENQPVGKVISVQELPAYNQLEIKRADGGTFLLPFTKELVPEIDLTEGVVKACIPEGLETLE